MKRVLLALAVMGLVAGSASAQWETDLTGGWLLCHHPPGLVYTSDTPSGGWCPLCDFVDCYENNDEITMDPIVWFVIARFKAPSEWCGVEFGVTYTPYSWIPLEYDVCAPGGFLTIPTAGWPGPDEGISIAATDTPWTGQWAPVYWWGGYGYYGGTWCLIDNPGTVGEVAFANCDQVEFPAECFGCIGFGPGNFGYDCCRGACCHGPDCTYITEDECTSTGGEFQGFCVPCDPNPCGPPPVEGACCYPDGTCDVVESGTCTGVYLGDDTDCGPPNPCPQPGACCVGADCYFVLETECTTMGGTFLGDGIPCVPNPCVEYGACCYPDGTCLVVESGTCTEVYLGDGTDCGPPNPCPQPAACCIDHTCFFVLEDECGTMMGVWMGDGTTCEPDNPCDIFTPADPASWGTIKAIYR